MIDLLGEAQIGPGMLDSGARADGVTAHVELVDDRVFQGRARIDAAVALGRCVDHQASSRQVAAGSPRPAAGEGPRVRVEQDLPRVVAMAMILGPVDPIAVAEFFGEAVDPDVPVVAGAIEQGVERDLGVGLAVARLRQDQPDRRPVPAEQDEIDPAGRRRRPGGQRAAARDQQQAVAIRILEAADHLRQCGGDGHGGRRPKAGDRPTRPARIEIAR